MITLFRDSKLFRFCVLAMIGLIIAGMLSSWTTAAIGIAIALIACVPPLAHRLAWLLSTLARPIGHALAQLARRPRIHTLIARYRMRHYTPFLDDPIVDDLARELNLAWHAPQRTSLTQKRRILTALIHHNGRLITTDDLYDLPDHVQDDILDAMTDDSTLIQVGQHMILIANPIPTTDLTDDPDTNHEPPTHSPTDEITHWILDPTTNPTTALTKRAYTRAIHHARHPYLHGLTTTLTTLLTILITLLILTQLL